MGLAGCLGNNDEEADDGQQERQYDGPEGAVEKYLIALEEGDLEAANEVLHPNANAYPIDDTGDIENFTIGDIEAVSPAEYVERFPGVGSEQEQDIEDALREIQDLIGADEVVNVIVTFEDPPDGLETDAIEEDKMVYFAIRDEGDWQVASTLRE